MNSIHHKEEIISATKIAFSEVIEFVDQQNDNGFENGPENKWTTAQQIDHLLRSVKPLNQALRMPKFLIKSQFGAPNREGRSFEGLVKRYKERLAEGGGARGRFIPEKHKMEKKSRLLDEYGEQRDRLVKIIARWKEEDLDRYLLPHPLLGKLTVREMLFFTIHHNRHHLQILNRDYV